MQDREFVLYAIKFGSLFAFFYFGTYLFIGITAEGGYYIPFLAKYFNYVDWLRALLLNGTKILLQLFGYTATLTDKYHLQINHANKVQLIYSCLGYGVISFWLAFVLTHQLSSIKKISWILLGFFLIVFSNMIRIAMILIANYKQWKLPFNIEHHFLYNVIAYTIVIVLAILFLKQKERI